MSRPSELVIGRVTTACAWRASRRGQQPDTVPVGDPGGDDQVVVAAVPDVGVEAGTMTQRRYETTEMAVRVAGHPAFVGQIREIHGRNRYGLVDGPEVAPRRWGRGTDDVVAVPCRVAGGPCRTAGRRQRRPRPRSPTGWRVVTRDRVLRLSGSGESLRTRVSSRGTTATAMVWTVAHDDRTRQVTRGIARRWP